MIPLAFRLVVTSLALINGTLRIVEACSSPLPPHSPASSTGNSQAPHQHGPSSFSNKDRHSVNDLRGPHRAIAQNDGVSSSSSSAAARTQIDHNIFKYLPDLTHHLLPDYLRKVDLTTSYDFDNHSGQRLSSGPSHGPASTPASQLDRAGGFSQHQAPTDTGYTSGLKSETWARWGFTRSGQPRKRPGPPPGSGLRGKLDVAPDAKWGRKKNGEPRRKPGALPGSLTLAGIPKRDSTPIRKEKGGTGMSRARGNERTDKQKQADMKKRKNFRV